MRHSQDFLMEAKSVNSSKINHKVPLIQIRQNKKYVVAIQRFEVHIINSFYEFVFADFRAAPGIPTKELEGLKKQAAISHKAPF